MNLLKNKLDHPSAQLVEHFIEKYDTGYNRKVDDAINVVIELFPQNTHSDEVLVKVRVINFLYKTRIRDTDGMADRISMLNT